MKYSFAVALLLGTISAVHLNKSTDPKPIPWDKDTLPSCPADGKRTIMDDGRTHIVKYPRVGASCKIQVVEEGITLIQLAEPEVVPELSAEAAPAAPSTTATPAANATAPANNEEAASQTAELASAAVATKAGALNKSTKVENAPPVKAAPKEPAA